MNIRILALDLDGTLYNTEKIVTDANKKALAAVREKGVKVVITTGRPLKAIGNLLEELDLLDHDDYSITFNGVWFSEIQGRFWIRALSVLTRFARFSKL